MEFLRVSLVFIVTAVFFAVLIFRYIHPVFSWMFDRQNRVARFCCWYRFIAWILVANAIVVLILVGGRFLFDPLKETNNVYSVLTNVSKANILFLVLVVVFLSLHALLDRFGKSSTIGTLAFEVVTFGIILVEITFFATFCLAIWKPYF